MVKRITMVVIAAVGAMSLFGAVAFAASSNHSAQGTPGDPNCFGQSAAWVAQGGLAAYYGLPPTTGIGNTAKALDATNQELKALGESECVP